jgi:hypothetical protein
MLKMLDVPTVPSMQAGGDMPRHAPPVVQVFIGDRELTDIVDVRYVENHTATLRRDSRQRKAMR